MRPLGALYGAIAARRMQRNGLDAGIPVLCVGNYHVGGAGKTPTVLALAKLLRELGETPVVLSRGYGGRLRGPVKVDPARHAAADVGDEPLMLARDAAGRGRARSRRRRCAGEVAGRQRDPDGRRLPESRVAKDASLIVIDGERGLGNGRVFPAGPLRAPLRPQLARTDALVMIGDGARRRRCRGGHRRARQAGAARASEAGRGFGRALRGKRVLAFAGIGDPARFFRTLRASGIEVVAHARLRRSSSVFEAEIEARRRGQPRRADTGDDGKGSGAAARPARIADGEGIVPFAVTLDSMTRRDCGNS